MKGILQHFSLTLLALPLFTALSFGQKKQDQLKKEMLQKATVSACNCIDSLPVVSGDKTSVYDGIQNCVETSARTYAMGIQMMDQLKAIKKSNKDSVTIQIDENGEEMKEAVAILRSRLLSDCQAMKIRVAQPREDGIPVSKDSLARKYYGMGQDAGTAGDYQKAVYYFRKSIEADSNFVFAWDNMGLFYRKLDNYDSAIYAYQRSININPDNPTPYQNLAVAYRFQKEWDKAINTYAKLKNLDDNDPESYFGLSQIYFEGKQDDENALVNACKAFLLYVDQNSPYRSDAEQLIYLIHQDMKKHKQDKKFFQILERFDIKYD